MKARFTWLLATLALAGCASAPGVHFADSEQMACALAQADGGCVVMTRRQLQTFYELAFQAGREREKGKADSAMDGPAPWQLPESNQRDL